MNRYWILIISFYFFFKKSVSLFEDYKKIRSIETINDFKDFVYGKDILAVLYSYISLDCPQCIIGEYAIGELSDKFEETVEFAHIDCDKDWTKEEVNLFFNEFPICKVSDDKQWPKILYIIPPKEKYNQKDSNSSLKRYNSPDVEPYSGQLTLEHLTNFTKTLIPAFRTLIEDEKQANKFFDQTSGGKWKKFVLFTDKNETPNMFRTLASRFREEFDFGEIRATSDKLIEKYNITEYPTLILFSLNPNGNYN